MNKILRDERKGVLHISENCYFKEEKENILYLILDKNVSLHFEITANTIIYLFSYQHSFNLEAHLLNNANLTCYIATLSKKNTKTDIKIFHDAKKTTSKVINHAISYSEGSITSKISLFVPKGIKDCICSQENIIHLFDNGTGRIDPNLFIDEYDVTANHAAYLGPFKSEEIFYLKTKGLKDKICYQLLMSAFLLTDSLNKDYNKEVLHFLKDILKNFSIGR